MYLQKSLYLNGWLSAADIEEQNHRVEEPEEQEEQEEPDDVTNCSCCLRYMECVFCLVYHTFYFVHMKVH